MLAISRNATHAVDSASVLDLISAWHAAQSKDPSFSAARAGAVAGKQKNAQALALNRPQVNLMAGTGLVNAYNKISNA